MEVVEHVGPPSPALMGMHSGVFIVLFVLLSQPTDRDGGPLHEQGKKDCGQKRGDAFVEELHREVEDFFKVLFLVIVVFH